MFRSHVIVVEPLGLLARKRQDLLGAWSKIIHYCVSEAERRLSLLKVDTTPALQHLTSKPKEIECRDEYQSSVLRSEILPQSPKLTTHRKAPKLLVHRYLTTSFTDVLTMALGAWKANPTGTTTAPTARRSTCMFETNACQRAGGDGAGLPLTSKRRASVKKRMVGIMAKIQLAQLR